MKVTVCFEQVNGPEVSVIVPVGNGELPVKDLIDKAILRYKKATGKPADYWVAVHNLKTKRDNGILDPDDLLNDVADDKEQIIADFHEQGGAVIPPNGGDGTSNSSAGTSSPDVYHMNGYHHDIGHYSINEKVENGQNDVIITQEDLNAGPGSNLIVRRGSEPVLNVITAAPSQHPNSSLPRHTNLNKRWSGNLHLNDKDSVSDIDDGMSASLDRHGGNGEESRTGTFNRFARDSARQSLASNTSTLDRWMSAQEKQVLRQQAQMHVMRREPLGGTDDKQILSQTSVMEIQEESEVEKDKNMNELRRRVVLSNLYGPLGIHVVPEQRHGRDLGLCLQRIESGSLVDDDGQLHVDDIIVKINGNSLLDVPFEKAQSIFRQGLETTQLRLEVERRDAEEGSPDVSPEVLLETKPANNLSTFVFAKPMGPPPPRPSSPRKTSISSVKIDSSPDGTSVPNSPSKKIPPAVPQRHPNTALSKTKLVGPTNTRKIGKKVNISLLKGKDGLGFSVTTRDNPAGGNCPIYIKNILSKGAAVDDGRLQSGDRLLQVNGVEMTGKSQAQAVATLRNTPMGSTVELVVSRQVDEYPKLPRELNKKPVALSTLQPPEQANDDGTVTSSHNKHTLAFEIPLNDTESAGLGLSVKGNTVDEAGKLIETGIFIKSVISGGAAYKDGRLQVNDRLLEVNGTKLYHLTNAEAMGALKQATQKESARPGYMKIKVARNIPETPLASPIKSPLEVRISTSEPPESDISHMDDTVRSAYDSVTPRAELDAQHSYKGKNPIMDRLLAGGTSSLRNISYQKATQDLTMDDSNMASRDASPNVSMEQPEGARAFSTPRGGQSYENEVEVHRRENHSVKPRPNSTLGFSRPTAELESLQNSHSKDDLTDYGPPDTPNWVRKELEDSENNQDALLDSTNMSEIDPEKAFQRDGFGRQSISEKRKGDMDPTLTEAYNKIKHKKEKEGEPGQYESDQPVTMSTKIKRAASAESILNSTNDNVIPIIAEQKEVGKLGLQKSSSLESLQTAVQDVVEDEEGALRAQTNRGVVRGRVCNESFRAAVDRSYEQVPAIMDPLDEESGESSQRSSFSEDDKKKRRKSSKKDKGGILKGLGNMFRFGKHRKSLEDRLSHSTGDLKTKTEAEILRQRRHQEDEIEQYNLRRAAQLETEQLKDPPRRLNEYTHSRSEGYLQKSSNQHAVPMNHSLQVENQRNGQIKQEEHQQESENQQRYDDVDQSRLDVTGQTEPASQTERMQRFRISHQKAHMARNGVYPTEEQDEIYEQELQEYETRRLQGDNQLLPPKRRQPEHTHRTRQDSHSEQENRHSHYQNMEEYQENLRRHERQQQKYKELGLAKQCTQWEREQQQQQQHDHNLKEQQKRERDKEGFLKPAPPDQRVPRPHDPEGHRSLQENRPEEIRRSQRSEIRRGQGYDPRRDRDQGYYSDPRRDHSYEPEPRRGYDPETRTYDYDRDSRRSQSQGREHNIEYDRHVQDSRGFDNRPYERRGSDLDPHHNIRNNYYDSRTVGSESGYWPQNPYRSKSTTPLDSDDRSGYDNRARSHTPVNYQPVTQSQIPRHGSAFHPPQGAVNYDPRGQPRGQRLYGSSSVSERQEWQRNGVLKSHY